MTDKTGPFVKILVFDNDEVLRKDIGGVQAGPPTNTWKSFHEQLCGITRSCRLKYVIVESNTELPTYESVQRHFGEIVPKLTIRLMANREGEF